MNKKLKLYLPLIILAFLGAFLLRGLWLDPKKLPSVFIGKPLPQFSLPLLPGVPAPTALAGLDLVTNRQLADKPYLLNVFASWCQACLVEHPVLLDLARQGKIRLVGLAYKDELESTRAWLARHGNPYSVILVDQKGDAGIEFGVYGVPETFLIDASNTVLLKNVGPVSRDFYVQQVVPALNKAGVAP